MDRLTQRERAVVLAFADTERGESTWTVAAKMHLSRSTVRSHLRSIFVKIGVDNISGMVAAAYRQGLMRETEVVG
jgi:DNA-binding CsgD family transcriptional regulator